ncbi:unnamed protein product [Ixodes persulcatus]
MLQKLVKCTTSKTWYWESLGLIQRPPANATNALPQPLFFFLSLTFKVLFFQTQKAAKNSLMGSGRPLHRPQLQKQTTKAYSLWRRRNNITLYVRKRYRSRADTASLRADTASSGAASRAAACADNEPE